MSAERIYLNCPFEEKDACKALGGRWDGDARKWYITDDMDDAPFAQWMQDGVSEDSRSRAKQPIMPTRQARQKANASI